MLWMTEIKVSILKELTQAFIVFRLQHVGWDSRLTTLLFFSRVRHTCVTTDKGWKAFHSAPIVCCRHAEFSVPSLFDQHDCCRLLFLIHPNGASATFFARYPVFDAFFRSLFFFPDALLYFFVPGHL